MRTNDQEYRDDLPTLALKGALAALVGGLAMKLAWDAGERTLPPARRLGSPTKGAVDRLAASRGVALSDRQRDAGAMLVFAGTMATWGAVYGMVQGRAHPPALVHGLLLGGLVYAANFTPPAPLVRAGVVPGERHGRQRAVPLGAHAVFGLATAAAFERLAT